MFAAPLFKAFMAAWRTWLPIVALFLLGWWVNHTYNNLKTGWIQSGIDQENAVWLDREEKRIADRDDKIDKLEKKATELANGAAKAAVVANAKVAELNKKLLEEQRKKSINTVIYTQDGKPAQCQPGGDIYLGAEFSRSWNEYNIKVLAK